ncbi:hypothetical protein [Streptomyces virginiae]|uniref:hypothetical protein n=1 Tax=Streptomyces virginiae TaxID=1961 RepID=UPI0036F6D4F9
MLASLLPGIRELRTPLATGYIYLLTVFLLVAGRIPARAEAPEPMRLLYDAVEWMGKPAALAAVTFVAYLVGSVLAVRAATINHALGITWQLWLRRLARRREKHGHAVEIRDFGDFMGLRRLSPTFARFTALRAELTKSAADTLVRHFEDRGGTPELFMSQDEMAWHEGLVTVVLDLPQLRTRLYGADKDLYGDYDRLTAEADLKVNVGFATTVLSCVIAVLGEPWWVLLSLPMAFLIYRGLSTAKQANDVLVQAIVTGVVTSPNIEEYLTTAQGDGNAAQTGEDDMPPGD